MSNAPVVSVTDELIAELEKASTFTNRFMVEVQPGSLALLLAERSELLRDAKRYRWLRDKSINAEGVFPMVSMTDDIGDQVSNWLFGKAVDDAIDAAMQP